MPSERFIKAIDEYAEALGGMEAYRARRKKCQTDLWFLSKEIFHRDLFEQAHRPLVNFFLKKQPFTPSFRKGLTYTLAEFQFAIGDLASLAVRKGVLLYPRGSFKSSLDEDDITQYIICFPDIRIMIMVGESSLGEAFVPNIKQRFILEENHEPTEFQLLFPEFIIDLETDKDRGGAQEYWCPARKLKQVSPTLGSISILGSTSGWHCDVFKCDDVVTDTTPIETSISRNKLVRKFVSTANLLDPHGILELIGTHYHEEDLYEHVRTMLPNSRYLCASSWTPLPHARLKKQIDLMEQDVLLLFPERQGFAFLREKLLLDERTFCLQQLNNPQLANGPTVKFRIEDLRAATVRVPQEQSFKRYNFWDVATTDSEGSDYSAGGFLSINITKWIAYLHILVMDKFTPSELAFQIAMMAKQTSPEAVMFEKYTATNACWLEQEVIKLCVSMGYAIPLRTFKVDKTKGAKGPRISGLEPLIRQGRLYFSNLIPNIELLYKQFTEWRGIPNSKRHDDGPDMLSFLRLVMPMTGLDLPKPPEPGMNMGLQTITNEKENQAWAAAQAKDPAVRAFLNQSAILPAVVMPAIKPEGYFPGQ